MVSGLRQRNGPGVRRATGDGGLTVGLALGEALGVAVGVGLGLVTWGVGTASGSGGVRWQAGTSASTAAASTHGVRIVITNPVLGVHRSVAGPGPDPATVTLLRDMKTFDDLYAELAEKAATRPEGSGTVAALDAGVHSHRQEAGRGSGRVLDGRRARVTGAGGRGAVAS